MGRSQRQRTQRERRSCASRAATTAATAGVLTVSAVSFTTPSIGGEATQDANGHGAGVAGGPSGSGASSSSTQAASAVPDVSTQPNKLPGHAAGTFCGQACLGDGGNDEEAEKAKQKLEAKDKEIAELTGKLRDATDTVGGLGERLSAAQDAERAAQDQVAAKAVEVATLENDLAAALKKHTAEIQSIEAELKKSNEMAEAETRKLKVHLYAQTREYLGYLKSHYQQLVWSHPHCAQLHRDARHEAFQKAETECHNLPATLRANVEKQRELEGLMSSLNKERHPQVVEDRS
ncbi:unnamed protein product [Amoebophrya sp. A25]|nr:unnamed protein product [Amoebophrya sp. A25]|eukprot:GSA25T00023260001.1